MRCFGVIEETHIYVKREEYICQKRHVNRSKERGICAERDVFIFQKKGTYVQKERRTCCKGEGHTYLISRRGVHIFNLKEGNIYM